MDKSLIIRILGLALTPIILRGLTLLVMREQIKEESSRPNEEKIVIKPPKVICWVAIIEMLIFTAILIIITLFPNGTESIPFTGTDSPFVYLFFSFFVLLGAYLLYAALVWRVEVFKNEDFFILRDFWGRRHKIHYSDCICYQYQYRGQEIIIRNTIKNFTVSDLLINCEVLLSALQQHNVKLKENH